MDYFVICVSFRVRVLIWFLSCFGIHFPLSESDFKIKVKVTFKISDIAGYYLVCVQYTDKELGPTLSQFEGWQCWPSFEMSMCYSMQSTIELLIRGGLFRSWSQITVLKWLDHLRFRLVRLVIIICNLFGILKIQLLRG